MHIGQVLLDPRQSLLLHVARDDCGEWDACLIILWMALQTSSMASRSAQEMPAFTEIGSYISCRALKVPSSAQCLGSLLHLGTGLSASLRKRVHRHPQVFTLVV